MVTSVTFFVRKAISLMDGLPLHVKQMRNSTQKSQVVYVSTYSREQKFKTTQFFKRKIIVLSTNHFKIISICLTISLLI